jgi:4-amino-4-deoxy-L-arabinose transferase-like glycosyltransferase
MFAETPQRLGQDPDASTSSESARSYHVGSLRIFILLGIFLLPRILSWKNTTGLEDHDSVRYLMEVRSLAKLDFTGFLRSLGVDDAPLFPFLGALFSLPASSVETGARLCSLVFSLGVFVAILGIARRFTSLEGAGLGLLIMSLNPVLILLSFTPITEPSYLGVVYLSFWAFWLQYEKPTKRTGLLLGLLFGLAFLTRAEGLVFLAAIPVMQFVHFLFFRQARYRLHQFCSWALVFVFGFALLASVQVWQVSQKMGTWAINGRQVWMAILDTSGGASSEAKIYGLDYSPREVNLAFVQSHPEVFRHLQSANGPKQIARQFALNVMAVYNYHLSGFLGALGIVFLGFGLLSLLKAGRSYELFLVLAFFGATLVAPLVYVWAWTPKYLAIVGPLMMLLEGVGILYVADVAGHARRLPVGRTALCSLCVVALLGFWARPLWSSLRSPDSAREFSPRDVAGPLVALRQDVEANLHRRPRIAARTNYFSYLADAANFALPHTDYRGLVRYCELNDIDYVFLERRRLSAFPFLGNFQRSDAPRFKPVYAGDDSGGFPVELYRFERVGPLPETTTKVEGDPK